MIPIKHEERTYSLIVDQHEDGYLGYFPTLPGCYSWGPTYGAAVKGAGEALEVHLRSLPNAGKKLPEPAAETSVSLIARVLAFAPFLRNVHRNEIAAAAAIATCIAVILNVGPFTQTTKSNALFHQAVAAASQPLNESEWSLRPSLEARDPAPVSEPTVVTWFDSVRASVQPALISAAGAASTAPTPLNRGNDEEVPPVVQPPQNFELASSMQARAPNPESALAKQDKSVGIWAPEGGACSAHDFEQGMLPTVISSDGAWAGDTFCLFKKKEQIGAGWKVIAECSSPREHWTSNVRLKISDGRLIWTSKRGAQAYVRCAPNVLMAQAR